MSSCRRALLSSLLPHIGQQLVDFVQVDVDRDAHRLLCVLGLPQVRVGLSIGRDQPVDAEGLVGGCAGGGAVAAVAKGRRRVVRRLFDLLCSLLFCCYTFVFLLA